MTTSTTPYNAVLIDTGPPGPHSGFKVLRIANVEGGSGNYQVTWRPLCDLTEDERRQISCQINYQDDQFEDVACDETPPCTYFTDIATCCRSGTCGGSTTYTRYRTGATDRELIVSIDNIPQFAQNFGPPCQLIFHWQLTDLDTGDQFDGCCGVVFAWRAITPAPLAVDTTGCNAVIEVDTSTGTPAANHTISIVDVTGGVGPYEVTWTEVGATGTCYGTVATTYSDSVGLTNNTLQIALSAVPLFSVSNPSAPCTHLYNWEVRDLGVLSDEGLVIGRIERGQCALTLQFKALDPPSLVIEVLNDGDLLEVQTGAGIGTGAGTLQVGTISGGSGNYSITWDVNPIAFGGSCLGSIDATVNGINPAILNLAVTGVPQFSDNLGSECLRTYRARIVDTVTGVIQYADGDVLVQYVPDASPELQIFLENFSENVAVDTGSCSGRVSASVVTLSNLGGGSGIYTIAINADFSANSSAGLWSLTTGDTNASGPTTATVTLQATAGTTGTYAQPVVFTATDTVTGQVTTATATPTFTLAATTNCAALTAVTDACPVTISYSSGAGSSGSTAVAHLVVNALGGSGSYAISWNELPTATTGPAYVRQVSQAARGSTARELSVYLSAVTANATSTSTLTFQWTITDLLTATVLQGTCTATFDVVNAPVDCLLTSTGVVGGATTVSASTTAPIVRTFTVQGLAGAPSYDVEWSANLAGGRVALSAATATVAGPDASVNVTFTAPANNAGTCLVTVRARVVDSTSSDKKLCTDPSITYNYTWNTLAAPTGTIVCDPGAIVLDRTDNADVRTYSMTGVAGVTGYAWNVTGCPGIVVAPDGGSAKTIVVTVMAPMEGVAGSCVLGVACSATGPGGVVSGSCSNAITYNTMPSAIDITSVSNSSQTMSIASNAVPHTATFAGCTANHTVGAGGPYTYEWALVSTSGSCSAVTWSPTTATTQTITPVASVPTDEPAGTCQAIWSVVVRDVNGNASAPTSINIQVSYAPAVFVMTVTDQDAMPFEGLNSFSYRGYPGWGWSFCSTGTYTACGNNSINHNNGVVPAVDNGTYDPDAGKLMRVTPTGGTAPYTVVIKNVTGTFTSLPNCLRWSTDPDVATAAISSSSTSGSNTVCSKVVGEGVPTDFGIVSSCSSTLFSITGNYTVTITDALGAVQTATYPYTAARLASDRPN